MIQGIDHLVIACRDLEAAASELEEAAGIACTGGGRHPDAGTMNRLAFLADGSYLELIGVDDPALARRSPVGAAAIRALEGAAEGLATFALLVDDIGAARASLAAAGSSFGPPVHGTRRRDDGETVEWWTSVPAEPLGPTVPFLIQHAFSGAEWGSEAMAARRTFVHPVGSPVVLARLDLAVADPPAPAAWLHAELGIDLWAVADLAVADVGPHVLRFVPRREMAVPAVVTLGAEVASPRSVEILGMRIDVEPVELPLPDLGRD